MEECEGALTEDETIGLVNLCAAITMTMEMQGRFLTRLIGKPGWDSTFGWVTWGPEMAVIAIHDSVTVAQNSSASFTHIIDSMKQSADVEVFKPGGKGEPNVDVG